MDACICRSDRIFGMHIVRQRDIDGIDVPAPKAIIIPRRATLVVLKPERSPRSRRYTQRKKADRSLSSETTLRPLGIASFLFRPLKGHISGNPQQHFPTPPARAFLLPPGCLS